MLAIGRVTSHNPPWRMNVAFKTLGQGVSLPIQLLRPYADAIRAKQSPMPGIGTWGLVAFPNGDIRNGLWLGSYLPAQIDALHTDGSPSAPFIDYESHFSGHWHLLDGVGNYAQQFADGSYVVAASGTTLPTTNRHIIDSANKQQQVEFTQAERIPSPPSPFAFTFHHMSGTQVEITPAGAVNVTALAGQTVTVSANGCTLQIDASGNLNITLPGAGKMNITQGGAPSDFLVLVSKLLAAFNAHIHTGVTTGGGNTGAPLVPLTAPDIKSAVVDVSG